VAPLPDQRQALGRAGEERVLADYTSRGYELLDRNWRDGKRGELDLVLLHGATVVVCEVKTRRSDAFGDALEAVTVTKQQRLRRLASAWLMTNRDRVPHGRIDIRIDVAAVRLGRDVSVEIVEGAC
jgi:putative endonuclease